MSNTCRYCLVICNMNRAEIGCVLQLFWNFGVEVAVLKYMGSVVSSMGTSLVQRFDLGCNHVKVFTK